MKIPFVTATALKRYLERYPDATPDEIAGLKDWIKQGNSPSFNGYYLSRENGSPMDFIEAERFERDLYQMFLENPSAFANKSVSADSSPDTSLVELPF